MRRVTTGLFMSVDGVVGSPHLWQFDSFDDELGAAVEQVTQVAETVLLGRTTYEEWAAYWPDASVDEDFAGFINGVEKLVASRALTGELEWQNARLLDGELEGEVTRLRESEGGDIAVCGSVSVVRQLLFAGLLDSLTLMVNPVVAGRGRRLFEAGDPTTRLTLEASTTTAKGNVLLTYGRRA